MTEKEKTIQLYMRKLDLTHEEAEQMWLDEQEDNLPELTADQKQVEKAMRQADRKIETVKRVRERKPDDDKRHLMRILETAIGYNPNVTDFVTINPEREVEFVYNGNKYRLTLSKPRISSSH